MHFRDLQIEKPMKYEIWVFFNANSMLVMIDENMNIENIFVGEESKCNWNLNWFKLLHKLNLYFHEAFTSLL